MVTFEENTSIRKSKSIIEKRKNPLSTILIFSFLSGEDSSEEETAFIRPEKRPDIPEEGPRSPVALSASSWFCLSDSTATVGSSSNMWELREITGF